MRHASRPTPRAPLFVGLALAATLAAACDGCDEGREEVVEALGARADPRAEDLPPADTRLPSAAQDIPAGCLRFCERSLACADAEGVPVRPELRDCERSCGPEGTHRAAPPSVWACADRACGQAFQACSVAALVESQRRSELGAFPITCEGLCHKAAWCAERTGRPPGPGEEDCEAACRPGGAYAQVPARELGCVEAACGPPLEACRAAGGPSERPPGAPGAP